jgi:serine/threonine-protein kinase SRPK3
MVQIFGKLPEPWWSEWDVERQQYFDEGEQSRKDWEDGIMLVVKFPLEGAIKEIRAWLRRGTGPDDENPSCETDNREPLKPRPRVVGLETRDFMDLLLKMLRLKPEERVLAKAVLGA